MSNEGDEGELRASVSNVGGDIDISIPAKNLEGYGCDCERARGAGIMIGPGGGSEGKRAIGCGVGGVMRTGVLGAETLNDGSRAGIAGEESGV